MAIECRVLTSADADDMQAMYDFMEANHDEEWDYCRGYTVADMWSAQWMRVVLKEDPPVNEINVAYDGKVLVCVGVIWLHDQSLIRIWYNGTYLNEDPTRFDEVLRASTQQVLSRYGQSTAFSAGDRSNEELFAKRDAAFPRYTTIREPGRLRFEVDTDTYI